MVDGSIVYSSFVLCKFVLGCFLSLLHADVTGSTLTVYTVDNTLHIMCVCSLISQSYPNVQRSDMLLNGLA